VRLRDRARRRLLPVYHHAVRRSPDLRYLFFEITQRCNLACQHCGSDCSADVQHDDLAVDTALGVARQIAATMDPARITAVITGGEPMCHPGVFELGDGLQRLGFPWGMVTNGWLWTPEAMARAQAARMRSVCVSLDGLETSHDGLRGRAGSFQRAVAAIDLMLGPSGPPVMDVVTCVHPGNLDQLEGVHDLLIEHGVPAWRLFTIDPIGRGADPALQLDTQGMHRLLRFIATLRQRSPMKVNFGCGGHLGYTWNRRVRDADYVCLAGVRVAGVMVNGDILACPNNHRALAQGNVHRDSFVQAWRDGFRPFRDRRLTKSPACDGCGEWGQCQGNDMHLWDPERGETRLCHLRRYELEDLAP
jgi:radical SAM protein with 4Fe4S-binding SPASM domain